MTRPLAVLLLAALLLTLYALMYAGWSRRARRHPSASVASTATSVATTATRRPDAPQRPFEPGLDPETGAQVRPVEGVGMVRAEGIYVSTTSTASRLDRVAAAGLGVRSRAAMTVDPGGVTWEREGAPTVHVDAGRLFGVSLERGMAGKFVGQRRLVVVAWRGEGEDFATGFLPRYAADRDRLLAAVQGIIAPSTAHARRAGGQPGGAA